MKSKSKNNSTKQVPNKVVSIFKTEGEWELIFRNIQQLGKKDLNSFLRSEARKLGDVYAESPKMISNASGDKVYKRPSIPVDSYNRLKNIADEMQIPVSAVIDRFIIQPLLAPKL